MPFYPLSLMLAFGSLHPRSLYVSAHQRVLVRSFVRSFVHSLVHSINRSLIPGPTLSCQIPAYKNGEVGAGEDILRITIRIRLDRL